MVRYVKRYKKGKWLIVCKECAKFDEFPLKRVESEDEFFDLVKKMAPDEVVVDNYAFGVEYEKEFKRLFPSIHLAVFDDTFSAHYADEVINPNLYAKKSRYKGLVPAFTKISLIPPLVETRPKSKRAKGIFISLGATDVKRVGVRLIKKMCSQNEPIMFYTTSANRDLKRLKRVCALCRRCKLFVDRDALEGLSRAKRAVVTASTLAWEALAIGVPFEAIEVARNQRFVARYLKKKRVKVKRV